MTGRIRDESDFRSRPSKRGSRPRSKQRPAHEEAQTAFVTGVDRGRYTLLVDEGLADERVVIAMKARELTRSRVVCGDRVDVVGDLSGDSGALCRIVRITERSSVLRRTADDTDPYERIIVANAHQLVIVTALAEPEPRPRMIDRCVVAAYDAGMRVLLCLTKADLADPEPLAALYRPLGVEVVVSHQGPDGAVLDAEAVERVRAELVGRTSVFVGHSGVGKSTLVNALVPGAHRATGHVNDVTGRGRQTSTSAVALRLPGRAGWVIDTPGVRSFGLAHVEPATILAAFEDLAEVADTCPRGCTHLAGSPDCELDAWAEADPDLSAARGARLGSFRRVLAARTEPAGRGA